METNLKWENETRGRILAARNGTGPADYRFDRFGPGVHLAVLTSGGRVFRTAFAD
jgi:hypothetical protein